MWVAVKIWGGAWPPQALLDPPLMPELFITYWKIRIIIQRSQRTERSESHQEDESLPSSFDHSVNIDHDSQAEAIIEDSHGTTDDDRLESSPTDLTNESSHFDTPLPSHMIPCSSSTSLDIAGSNEVSDIANSMCDDPVQPRQHRFPATLFGNKTRSFNPQWFNKHTWLEYSIKKDAAFCYVCRFFSTSTHGEELFVRTGYTDWKHARGKSGKTTHLHGMCMPWWHGGITSLSRAATLQ